MASSATKLDLTGATEQGVVFGGFFLGVIVSHVATYSIAGILAYLALDYRTFLQTGVLSHYMRPLDSPWVAAGPGLQVIRGAILALALYPFRRVFLLEPRGWLKLWGLFAGLGILSTCGPTPGSIEGLIYTRLAVLDHLHGLPEVLLQTLAFAWLFVLWCRRPKRWLHITITAVAGIAILMSVFGVLVPRPAPFGQN